MVKKTPKMFFRYNGEDMSLVSIYNRDKKRRGKSRYLLSVMVDVVKDDGIVPAKVVYVRNRNKRKEYLCIISTDVNLDENEIIRIYGKRWDIEVFFKVCKSYLNLSKECSSLSYDAMTAHTAVVFTRYMMLSLESRESNDDRSLGELFLYLSDEMSDITWVQAFQMLLQMFRTMLTENTELSDEKIEELVDAFMNALPALLKNIHNILGMTEELNKYNFSDKEMQDFELLYSNIYNKAEYLSLQQYLENGVREYFKKLTIPDELTMYDYLILSLTEKDAIISFNWDPFLLQAYRRNLSVGNLPMLIFPHGNVGMGICEKCHTMGYADTLCTECYEKYMDMVYQKQTRKRMS